MRTINFENRKIDYDKLIKYGFTYKETYHYETKIDNFKVIVDIKNNKGYSKIIDIETNDEYILVDVIKASGDFVGNIKEKYENVINDIIDKCSDIDFFQSKYAKKVIQYIKDKYDDDLEYLWEKFPNNAIWRNKHNSKWYGLIVSLPGTKIGLESDELIDIIDLRYQKDNIDEIIDNKKIFAGYHMNKKGWITIILNNMDIKEIYKFIDNSYNLSLNK